MNPYPKPLLFSLVVLFIVPSAVLAQDVLRIYGPGGPYPAMREAAEAFSRTGRVKVEVVAGPTATWVEHARKDADLIYAGAEYMMRDFMVAMKGAIDETKVTPLYLRPAAILVRPGNPKQIQDFPDLLKPGINVLVVHGAGQTALWEDMAGKQGDIRAVRSLRKNIRAVGANSAEAKNMWIKNPSLDAWLTWNLWQIANPALADLIPVSARYVIYRDCGIALTQKGKTTKIASQFVEFLLSPKGAGIFSKWGWIVPQANAP